MTDEQADATLRPTTPNPKLLVSKTWIQWAALVVLFGFFVLGLLAYRTYIAWMVFVALLPLGLLQLYESVNHGYYEARELSFLTNPTNRFLEWLRLPGDFVFIVFGVLPLLWLCWLGVRYRRPAGGSGKAVLFTESAPENGESTP